MVRNIPNKYTQTMLLHEIDASYRGAYDFFYLPIDFKNKCNVGYAFINFIDYRRIVPFFREFNAQRWKNFNSEKVGADRGRSNRSPFYLSFLSTWSFVLRAVVVVILYFLFVLSFFLRGFRSHHTCPQPLSGAISPDRATEDSPRTEEYCKASFPIPLLDRFTPNVPYRLRTERNKSEIPLLSLPPCLPVDHPFPENLPLFRSAPSRTRASRARPP